MAPPSRVMGSDWTTFVLSSVTACICWWPLFIHMAIDCRVGRTSLWILKQVSSAMASHEHCSAMYINAPSSIWGWASTSSMAGLSTMAGLRTAEIGGPVDGKVAVGVAVICGRQWWAGMSKHRPCQRTVRNPSPNIVNTRQGPRQPAMSLFFGFLQTSTHSPIL